MASLPSRSAACEEVVGDGDSVAFGGFARRIREAVEQAWRRPLELKGHSHAAMAAAFAAGAANLPFAVPSCRASTRRSAGRERGAHRLDGGPHPGEDGGDEGARHPVRGVGQGLASALERV